MICNKSVCRKLFCGRNKSNEDDPLSSSSNVSETDDDRRILVPDDDDSNDDHTEAVRKTCKTKTLVIVANFHIA